MGVDAFVVLANSSTTNSKAVSLWAVQIHMYGPNPVPQPNNRLAAKFGSPGATYIAYQFGKGFKGAPIAAMKRAAFRASTTRTITSFPKRWLTLFEEQYND